MNGWSSVIPRYEVRRSMMNSFTALRSGDTRLRYPRQGVGEASPQPGLTSCVVAPAVNRFLQHVGEVATQPGNLLLEPDACLRHQVGVALIPDFVAMRQRARHTLACRLDHVLSDGLGLERR